MNQHPQLVHRQGLGLKKARRVTKTIADAMVEMVKAETARLEEQDRHTLLHIGRRRRAAICSMGSAGMSPAAGQGPSSGGLLSRFSHSFIFVCTVSSRAFAGYSDASCAYNLLALLQIAFVFKCVRKRRESGGGNRKEHSTCRKDS